MTTRLLKKTAVLAASAAALFRAGIVWASDPVSVDVLDNLIVVGKESYGEGAVSADKTLPFIIATLLKQAMALLGVIMVVIIVYAGYMWMTAGGSEEKVSKAKKLITNAVIGIIIIFLAYAITSFVVEAVLVSSTV